MSRPLFERFEGKYNRGTGIITYDKAGNIRLELIDKYTNNKTAYLIKQDRHYNINTDWAEMCGTWSNFGALIQLVLHDKEFLKNHCIVEK